jgi:hypothetical protein
MQIKRPRILATFASEAQHQNWYSCQSTIKTPSAGLDHPVNGLLKFQNVCFWHLADNPTATVFVRYWTRANKSPACDNFELMMGLTEFAERHCQPGQATSECSLFEQQRTNAGFGQQRLVR